MLFSASEEVHEWFKSVFLSLCYAYHKWYGAVHESFSGGTRAP